MAHLIDKDALVAEIERLDEFYHLSKGTGGQAFIEGLLSFIDSLPKESHQELYDKLSKLRDDAFSNTTIESWEACLSEEPVSEDLEEAAENYAATDEVLPNGKVMINFQVEKAFRAGANWQKANLWKSADGDDLPEIDREVIALLDNGKVGFAHRPPEYWDGKNIITGKVTRHYPKTYDKGGWNIPNVKYWLDCSMPKGTSENINSLKQRNDDK